MMQQNPKIAILGAGLLGGSVALSLRKHHPGLKVSLWARRDQALIKARNLGIEYTSTDLKEIVADADIIILATPVGVMGDLAEKIIAIRGDDKFILTDVGSVKRLTHEVIEPIISLSKAVYIGSHPMAGSENAGIEAARVDLLDDAACIVTTTNPELENEIKILTEFWESLHCRVRQLTPEDHDYAVARISHFPHSLACIGAKVGLAFEDISDLAGGGLKDTTRVASGDPVLWAEILLENRDALQRSITESVYELNQFQELLKSNNKPAMLDYLAEAKRKRDLIK